MSPHMQAAIILNAASKVSLSSVVRVYVGRGAMPLSFD